MRRHRANRSAEKTALAKKRTADYMRRSRQDGTGGKIYYVQVTSGPIKIGFTKKRVEGRLKELQAGNPETLLLLAWHHGTQDQELELHERFRHLQIRKEWFRPHESLLSHLRSITIV